MFNRTFAGLFFLIYNNYGTKGLSTERLILLRNDRFLKKINKILQFSFQTERFSIDKSCVRVYNNYTDTIMRRCPMNKKPYSSAIKKTPFKYTMKYKGTLIVVKDCSEICLTTISLLFLHF